MVQKNHPLLGSTTQRMQYSLFSEAGKPRASVNVLFVSVLGKWPPKNETLSCGTRITWELANKGTWRLKQWQEYFRQGVPTVAMTWGWRTHCSVGQLWYFALVPTLYPWTWRSLVEQVTLEGGWQWQCRDLIQSFLAQSKPHSSPTQVHQRQWFS